jgi:ParB family chromosome partitioning protein
MSKSRLGKGLDALLSASTNPVVPPTTPSATPPTTTASTPSEGDADLGQVAIDQITPSPYQPRRHFDEQALQDLAASIKGQGLLQPLVVRSKAQGGFELIAGERRWRAAQLAGLKVVPVVKRQVSDQDASTIALVENIQREDLSPLEQAVGLERLRNEFNLTQQQLAELVGKSRAAIANSLRLLNLGGVARRLLEAGELEMGHARALLGLSGVQQDQAAQQTAAEQLSVRETEKLVRQWLAGKTTKAKNATTLDADVQALQRRLMDHLGASVRIRQKKGGAGELVIQYSSLEELDGLLKRVDLPE